ncbi:MAG: YHS domain-containing protein [Chloroherpetonaceae bacterium]|nr:YHS domain-containing protein [Chloroherpetonaceae bacterium]MDW8020730.1 YHS domain-containing protein [Chloroherpetonaceae bacterium]MDW8465716.1 YHS domain-containing protein [Chloroherpetonaceae bacterium]
MKVLISVLLALWLIGCSADKNVTKPFNKVCPVMGKPVSPKAQTVSYSGKVYGFCCNGCDRKFSADPAKYAANLSDNGETFIGTDKSSAQ